MNCASRRAWLMRGLAAACLTMAAMAGSQADPGPRLLELNTASRAQLESLRGLGPALVERLLLARQQRIFEGWADLRQRVRGIGPALAQRLSDQGLRVAGQVWQASAAALPAVPDIPASGPVSASTQTD